MNFIIYWISVCISVYIGYCFGKGRLIIPNIKSKKSFYNNYENNNGHPSSCTCVDCVNIRLKAKGYIR